MLVYGQRKALKQGLISLRMYIVLEAILFPLILAFVFFVLGKGGELSIPNSCFTLRNTDLRCDYASKMPTVTAVFNKKQGLKRRQKLAWLFAGLLAPGNVNLESNYVMK